jgi:UDP-glucose 4-epimerase
MRTGFRDDHPGHALGKMLLAFDAGRPFEITGSDFSTRDGTGIRDYVHVWDLAVAHVAALKNFDEILGDEGNFVAINLGSGRGTTVLELLDAFNKSLGAEVPFVKLPRREGDIAGTYVNIEKAQSILNWEPALTIEEGIRDSYRWHEICNTDKSNTNLEKN